MADASPAGTPRGGSGGFWQRKEAGLPIWAWVAIVGGGAAVIFIYMRMKSSSGSSTSTTPTTTTGATVPTGTGTGGGGFGWGGYGGAGTAPSSPPMVPASPTPASPGNPSLPSSPPMVPASPTPASPGNPSLPFQVQSGSGWWAGGSNWATDTPQQQQAAISAAQAAGPITDASGNEYEWIDPQEYQSIQGSGVQVYYEVLPGVFIPVPSNMASLAPGTPLYMQVPSGTAGNPSAPSTPSSPPVVPAYPLSTSSPQPVNGAPVYNGAGS
ncbi:MAG: hypothetical protein M0027_01130 [Candidatus Dormibacteraeota bacterium]|nr:hypothetical protein [Candidatus Dormibacteraeota bacterium]